MIKASRMFTFTLSKYQLEDFSKLGITKMERKHFNIIELYSIANQSKLKNKNICVTLKHTKSRLCYCVLSTTFLILFLSFQIADEEDNLESIPKLEDEIISKDTSKLSVKNETPTHRESDSGK